MAKETFKKGDGVSCKKWNGEPFLGVFEYTYADGTHCVLDVASTKRFNVHQSDIKAASDEETKEIKKLVKEKHLKPHEHTTNEYSKTKSEKSELDSLLEEELDEATIDSASFKE